jgi:hypothetical protein
MLQARAPKARGPIGIGGSVFKVRQQVFRSLDEVPPELKKHFVQFASQARSEIRIVDDITGEQLTFESWDEVPEKYKQRFPEELREQITATARGASDAVPPPDSDPEGVFVRQVKREKAVDLEVKDVDLGD